MQHRSTTYDAADRPFTVFEELYRVLFQQTKDAVFILSVQNCFVEVNPYACRLLGYTREELLNCPWQTITSPICRNCAPPDLDQGSDGKTLAHECALRHKDGWLIPVELTIQTLADGQLLVLAHDLTMQRQAEQARNASEQRFQQLLEHMLDVVVVYDRDMRISYISSATTRITGRPATDFIGRRDDEVWPPEVYEPYLPTLHEAFATGKVCSIETSLDLPTSRRLLRITCVPLLDEHGEVREVLGITQDQTDSQQTTAALHESERLLRAIIDNAAGIIWVKDLEGRFLIVNRYTEHVLSLPREAIIGHTIFDIFPAEAAEEYTANERQVLATGRALEFEEHAPLADGQHTYVSVKFPLRDADEQIYALGAICMDITERKQVEEALRESEERLRLALEAARQGLYDLNIQTGEAVVSPEYATMLGYDPATFHETNARWIERLHPDDREHVASIYRAYIHGELPAYAVEFRQGTRLGEWKWILSLGKIVARDAEGKPLRMLGTHTDITARKLAEEMQAKLEAQLRQAQKMESVGRLAGGVAHDFNNLLTVIQGYCEIIQAQLSVNSPLGEDVSQIQRASERAAALTRQLLAFSSKQILKPTLLDLNSLITNLRKMLERVIGEDIALSTILQPGIWPVVADPGQIEQVLLNLVINSRDAMPTGGMLTIETRNAHLDDDYVQTHLHAPAGPCAMIAITDTGCGMDEEVRSRIFEPFFTTKAPGKGTGLGLATAYGIIKQSGGTIMVYSEPDVGTTFKIYLPIASSDAADPVAQQMRELVCGGHETILLVEDEERVRHMARSVLQERGYTVLDVAYGSEALDLFAEHQGAIDLLVTDVVLPRMSGRVLAEQLKRLRPQLKILFMSGYTDDTVIRHGLLASEIEFLPKPFSSAMLATKVREVLDQ